MRERFKKPQLLLGFLLCFPAGILLANLTGSDSRALQNELTLTYLGVLGDATPGFVELFFYVAMRRALLFFALLIFGTGSRGIWAHRLLAAWSGLSYGYFCVLTVSAAGGWGILLGFFSLFPQCLLYVPVYLGLLELGLGETDKGRPKRLLCVFFLMILLLAGILLESYANPILLRKILKMI
jgi:hypothetical protein